MICDIDLRNFYLQMATSRLAYRNPHENEGNRQDDAL